MTDRQAAQLRSEYAGLRGAGENPLRWCAAKAEEYSLSYGEFVTRLGI